MRRALAFPFLKHNLKDALGNLVPNKIRIPGNFNFQKKDKFTLLTMHRNIHLGTNQGVYYK